MRAIVLNSFTGLDGLELSEVADPTPAAGEELVHVRAAALGPWDRASVDGAFSAMGGSGDFPQVQGWDFAGETSDGRRVLGFVAQPWMGVGALAEQIAVPSAILAPLPDTLGFPEGSALPVCALTARLLVDAAAISEGDLVLVIGAAGMVGGFAAQLAGGRGARVVAAVRDSDADEARRLGAEMVLSAGRRSRGRGSRAMAGRGRRVPRHGGTRGWRLGMCPRWWRVCHLGPDRGARRCPGNRSSTVQVQPDADATAELARRAAAGELTVRIAEVLPLERFRDAYTRLESGGLHGKIVLTP